MSSSKADWRVVVPETVDDNQPLFFSPHEWSTIEAATARIMPTDHDPGAREAGVVRFIDRYLSGITYIYAAADGSGFLELAGKEAEAWRARIFDMRHTYRCGIRDLDASAAGRSGGLDFVSLSEPEQDAALEELSGANKPDPLSFETDTIAGAFQMGAFDEGLPFFQALLLHTRQGFYGDPVYGGNRDRVGWKVIGFPGPDSLADTISGAYSLRDSYLADYSWPELIPHLRTKEARS
ncbi:gluconate 2-dehydrogenase subunit 3 family protein [Herbiconiux daphne]|uniref:Gluconate 2-dehydrogenase subunit 3 family protein n=1 Tax=Herbiconiux daphne TaxID=2970914 RepID=A0ABT2H472_9MICO|nr:gluconate 2-dehydrogenase subunit 3 family protein [Herbiconiux daphne]MCS5734720.1 gluconate 2-dehydrogenase subunit 3 family protein [Herbiconiux daphne]